jgi:hypothetical protein
MEMDYATWEGAFNNVFFLFLIRNGLNLAQMMIIEGLNDWKLNKFYNFLTMHVFPNINIDYAGKR